MGCEYEWPDEEDSDDQDKNEGEDDEDKGKQKETNLAKGGSRKTGYAARLNLNLC